MVDAFAEDSLAGEDEEGLTGDVVEVMLVS